MAYEQLTYDGLHKTNTLNASMARGTQKEFVFKHDFGASTNINSVRYFWRDSSYTVQLSLSTDNNSAQFDLTTDGECTITLYDENTQGITVSQLGSTDYYHGVEIVGTDGTEQAPFVGVITLIDEIVHDDATAPSLSWTTKATYDANLNALLLCNEATTLSVDADATDGTITVTSVAPFSAGDTIIIHDGTNSESHDIAAGGISGLVITLDATTLASDYTAEYTVVVKSF